MAQETDKLGELYIKLLDHPKTGDVSAWIDFERHLRECLGPAILYKCGNRTDICDDVLDRVLLKLWLRKTGYDCKRKLRPLLVKIAANEVSDILPKMSNDARAVSSNFETVATAGNDPAKVAEQEEVLSELKRCLSKLPERERMCIYLYYFKGRNGREIAIECGWYKCDEPDVPDEQRAHRSLRRGRMILREMLGDDRKEL